MQFDTRLKRQILSLLDDAERALRGVSKPDNDVDRAKRALDDAISKLKRADPNDDEGR